MTDTEASKNRLSSSFIGKKNRVSFILSILVFFKHFTVFSSFTHFSTETAAGQAWFVVKTVVLALFHVAVPFFFFLSAVLFFRNYTYSSTFRKLKSRFHSLCIPYLTWNTIWYIMALIGYYTPLSAFLGGVKAPLNLKTMLHGIFLYGYFEPFWFIFALIVLTAFCPIIYALMKNKWVGVGTIAVCCILFGCGLRVNTPLRIRSDIIIFYFMGAWIGIHGFDFFSKKRTVAQSLLWSVLYLVCSGFFAVQDTLAVDSNTLANISLVITTISCFAFWFGCDWICGTKTRPFENESFLIYAMHSLVGAILSKILYVRLPKTDFFLWGCVIVSFFGTIAVICLFGIMLGKRFPRIKRVLSGGR